MEDSDLKEIKRVWIQMLLIKYPDFDVEFLIRWLDDFYAECELMGK